MPFLCGAARAFTQRAAVTRKTGSFAVKLGLVPEMA
jgi:hypothetical protein